MGLKDTLDGLDGLLNKQSAALRVAIEALGNADLQDIRVLLNKLYEDRMINARDLLKMQRAISPDALTKIADILQG